MDLTPIDDVYKCEIFTTRYKKGIFLYFKPEFFKFDV